MGEVMELRVELEQQGLFRDAIQDCCDEKRRELIEEHLARKAGVSTIKRNGDADVLAATASGLCSPPRADKDKEKEKERIKEEKEKERAKEEKEKAREKDSAA